jgi:glucan phosphoethanolaminetransferase (alkaline phosphatase superfamily)
MMKILDKSLNSISTPNRDRKRLSWWNLFLITVLVVYFYVFMEWLFFVTKPSFMDVMELGAKFEVLLITGLLLSIICVSFLIILLGLSYVPWFSRIWKLCLYVGGLLPAILLAAISLLLVDNFTYTVFKFGVAATRGIIRGLYALLFLVVFVFWYHWVIRRLETERDTPMSYYSLITQSMLGIGLIVISLILVLPKLRLSNYLYSQGQVGGITRRPNILLLGSDGVNASNMSVYGYERDTTPNLRKLAKSSLLAENAFPNGANTSGSIISILTGKLPTKTRVIYPPDILRNSDSYQHLPGILRSVGYRTIEISVSHYMDAYTLNLRDGFDRVNERSLDQAGFHVLGQFAGFQDIGYFSSVLTERLSDRIFHIFFIQEMSNPYQEVTSNQFRTSDPKKVREIINYFKQADQPLFIHVHLMDTHGAKFVVNHQVFSAGQTQDSGWMTDFYDDAILEFDEYVGEIWSEFTKMGILDNTIIIIYSDHAEKYLTDQGVPLIIRFPKGEFSGRIHNNVQNLDIAPTILEYLGLPIPKWMEGQSLLAGEPEPTRLIFSTGVAYATVDESGLWIINAERIKPPFYQFGYLRAIVCQKWYYLNLRDFEWKSGEVIGHSAPCEDEILPDSRLIQKEMLDRLSFDGFDISTLQTFFSTPKFKSQVRQNN